MAINKVYIGLLMIIITATFGGITLEWVFDKDYTSLFRDDDLIAKEKWVVFSERTYFNKNSWYRTNVMCPRIISEGGYETATRCYYAPDTYEPLSRSLIKTQLEFINLTDTYLVRKSTPNYMYGTSGAYAGYVIEEMTFDKETEVMEEFPEKYTVSWEPKDTRNYKLVWRIESLKEINLPDGEYHNCNYNFGKIKIDLKDECSKLEKAVIKDQNKIYFYFTNERGDQFFDLSLIDPATITLTLEGFSQNISVELGSVVEVIANATNATVCVDVDHPDYGVNYSTGTNSTTFNLNITYFRETNFDETINTWNLSSYVYDGVYFSVDRTNPFPQDIFFKPDGTKMYGVDWGADKFFEYDCGVGWDLSTCSYNNVNLSTQDEISYGLFFKPDGTKMYESGGTGNKIYQYNCSDAWNLSSCSYSNLNITTQGGNPTGLFFKPDGTKLYELGGGAGSVGKFYQYTCSIAWDLSSCSFDNIQISTQDNNSQGMFFKPDGTTLWEIGNPWVLGSETGTIYQFSCSIAWNLSSCSYDTISISSQDMRSTGLFFKPDGTALYEVGYIGDKFYQYSIKKIVNITMDNRSDMKNASINVASIGTSKGVFINYGNLSERFNGKLQGNHLNNSEFKYSNTLYSRKNITFETAESEYIYFNLSNYPINLTFQINGFEGDEGNEIDFYEYFNDTNETTSNFNIAIGTAYPLGIFDNFEINTSEHWDVTETKSQNQYDSATTVEASDNYYYLRTGMDSFNSQETRYVISDYLTLGNQSILKLKVYQHCQGGIGVNYYNGYANVYLTDGTSSVLVKQISCGCRWRFCSNTFNGNITLKRTNHSYDTWEVYENNVGIKNISTSYLSDSKDWNLKLYTYGYTGGSGSGPTGASNYARVSLYRIWTSGIYLNRTDNELGYNSSTGNFTSDMFHTTSNNITAATLTTVEYKPSGTNIYYYLSADGTNFESVASGNRHVFTNSGKNLTYKVRMNTTNLNTPTVYQLRIQVLSLAIENVSFDLGNNLIYDWNYTTGILNSTNSPQNVTLDISGINTTLYKNTDYPIKIKTGTGGVLEITNFCQNSSMNPIELNYTEFENCDNCEINFTFSGDNITVDDVRFDYWGGNKTYTVLAHDDTYSTNKSYDITYYYSKFNVSIIPPNIDSWDIGANVFNWIQNFIPPFGNEDGDGNPFFNVQSLAYDTNGIDIYMRFNESVDSCAITWFEGKNHTSGAPMNVTLNTSAQVLMANFTSYEQSSNVSTWTNISCASENSTLIIPYFCFFSLCSDCIKTSDYASNCDLIE